MRLDKFFTSVGLLSRKECAEAAKKGRITVDGKVVKDASQHINEEQSSVMLDGVAVQYRKFT